MNEQKRCGCTACSNQRGCGFCCGQKVLMLSPTEYEILLKFAEIPFFPAAFEGVGSEPFVKDFEMIFDNCGAALIGLQRKKLISIDEDIPLAGFEYTEYSSYPVHGSIAITGLGQEVLERLEYRGMEENEC